MAGGWRASVHWWGAFLHAGGLQASGFWVGAHGLPVPDGHTGVSMGYQSSGHFQREARRFGSQISLNYQPPELDGR